MKALATLAACAVFATTALADPMHAPAPSVEGGAEASPAPERQRHVLVAIPCRVVNPKSFPMALKRQYNEEKLGEGTGAVHGLNSQLYLGRAGTYTVLISLPNGATCMVAAGKALPVGKGA